MQDVTKLRIWQRAWELRHRVERELAGIDALAEQLLWTARDLVQEIEKAAAADSPAGFISGLGRAICVCNQFQEELHTAARAHVIDKSRYVMFDMELSEIRRMTVRLRTRIAERSRARGR